ncbi:MAG: P27 family phage terminase small subunit [Vicinamibacteria bacterium]
MTTAAKTPSKLSAASAAWYRTIVSGWELDVHHLRLLERAARAWDRIEEARTILDRDGLVILDRFDQPKEHPAAKAERDYSILFARLVRELGLDDTPSPDETRPPRIGGRS